MVMALFLDPCGGTWSRPLELNGGPQEGKQQKSVEEEGTTRPSPTASFPKAYHAVPPSSTSRNLVARTGIVAEGQGRIKYTESCKGWVNFL